jgi:glutamate synthase domain-containing protein 3
MYIEQNKEIKDSCDVLLNSTEHSEESNIIEDNSAKSSGLKKQGHKTKSIVCSVIGVIGHDTAIVDFKGNGITVKLDNATDYVGKTIKVYYTSDIGSKNFSYHI